MRIHLAILAAAALAVATPALAEEPSCTLSTEMVGTVGGALTGGSTNQIWIVQQCAFEDGTVRTTAMVCEIDDDIDPRDAPTCSAPADVSGGLGALSE